MTAAMRVGALIFDMDGVMIDSERLYFQSEREIAATYGCKLRDEQLWPLMGRKPIEGMRLLREIIAAQLSAEELMAWRDRLMREKLSRDLQPMPGLGEILVAFGDKLKLAVATGAIREFLDLTLDRLQIRRYFSVLQTSDGLDKGKPDPLIYRLTCEKLQLPPETCIVLEDAQNGVLAAKRAGCRVIALPNNYTRGQDFSAADWVEADLFAAARRIEEIMEDIPSASLT